MWRHKLITGCAYIKAKFTQLREYLSNRFELRNLDLKSGIIIPCLIAFIVLYYLLGAWLSNNIDRNTDIEIPAVQENQSQTVETISYLINREVNDKIWSPNLPFFFPASILDNMPNYQLGIINGLSKFTSAFEKRIDNRLQNKENSSSLYKASVLLRYPGTIWMFSPDNRIKPVPSAGGQYRKARRILTKHNQKLLNGQAVFYKDSHDLAYILSKSKLNLAQSSSQLNASVRENSSSWFDFKADDIFYYNQGKIYAYYLLFKALLRDYKDIIVESGQYQNWISLNKALEDACSVRPLIIRNGELSSLSAPNHLIYLNNYILKSQTVLDKIIAGINTQHAIKEKK